ncbi:MAG TPA: AraC family transcriptional regulator [Puia sp.]
MVFEFTVHPSFNFLASFASKLNVRVFKNRLTIPPSLGKGYVKKIDIESDFKFVLHHYILNEDFHLRRLPPDEKNDLISIIFNSQEIPSQDSPDQENAIRFIKSNGSAIQIASSALGTETFFPAGSEVYFGVIGIRPSVLASLLQIKKSNSLIARILDNESAFFFHESMTPDAQKILKQLSELNDQNELDHFYYRIRVQELLYGLFSRLLHREDERQSPVNKADLASLYAIRTAIMADLNLPPRLSALAKKTGLSETKMKQLFRQVFGDTIYNYYQKARMEEAAFLIKKAGYSVSEAGYQLGFSNLSHFSRLFERHHGLTPKKYSLVG